MLTTDLYPYQDSAVDLILELGYGLIAYEMGLGKTIVALAAVEELLAEPAINFALLIVPASLKYQWAQAIGQFTDVDLKIKVIRGQRLMLPANDACMVIDGTPARRQSQYDMVEHLWPNYVIVSYEQVVNDFDRVYGLGADCVVLDEATAIKGFKAQRSKRIKKLDPQFAIALTGTPVENRPEELYSIMDFVCPDYLGSFWAFDKKYIVRNHWGGVEKYRNLDVLNERIKKVMARKTRLDPEVAPYMPEVGEKCEYIDLDKRQRELYDEISEEVVEDLKNSHVSGNFDVGAYYRGEHTSQDMSEQGRIMAKCLSLQMLCDHPDLIRHSANLFAETGGEFGSTYAASLVESGRLDGINGSRKFERVVEDVTNLLGSNPLNKVIVFSFFKKMVAMVQEGLSEFGSVTFTGDMDASAKAAAKAKFQTDPDCRIFIASDAGGYGVDLPQANYLINIDLADSAGKMDQRNARHVRAGSAFDKVFVVNYLIADSIEERIYSRLEFKRKVRGAVLDGTSGDTKGVIENDVISLTEFLGG